MLERISQIPYMVEGENYDRTILMVAAFARELLGIELDRRISAILISIIKVEYQLSYWGLMDHFKKHPEDLKRCELKREYSRS